MCKYEIIILIIFRMRQGFFFNPCLVITVNKKKGNLANNFYLQNKKTYLSCINYFNNIFFEILNYYYIMLFVSGARAIY